MTDVNHREERGGNKSQIESKGGPLLIALAIVSFVIGLATAIQGVLRQPDTVLSFALSALIAAAVTYALLYTYMLIARRKARLVTLYDQHGRPLQRPNAFIQPIRMSGSSALYTVLLAFLLAFAVLVFYKPHSYWRFVRDVRVGHANRISAIALSADEQYILTGSMDFYCNLWSASEPNVPQTWQDSNGLENGSKVFDVAIQNAASGPHADSPDSLNLFAVTYRGELIRWQRKGGAWIDKRVTVTTHAAIASQVEFDAPSNLLITAGGDGYVRFFDPVSLTAPRTPWGDGMRLSEVYIEALNVSHFCSELDIAAVDTQYVFHLYRPFVHASGASSFHSQLLLPVQSPFCLAYVTSSSDRYHVLTVEKTSKDTDQGVRLYLLRHFTIQPLYDAKEDRVNLVLRTLGNTLLREGFVPSCLALDDCYIYVGYKRKLAFPVPVSYASYLDVFDPACTPLKTLPLPGYVGAITPGTRTGTLYAAGGVKVLKLSVSDTDVSSIIADAVPDSISALSWISKSRFVTGSIGGELWVWDIGLPDRGSKVGVLSTAVEFAGADKAGRIIAVDRQSNVVLFEQGKERGDGWTRTPISSEGDWRADSISCACMHDEALYVAHGRCVTRIELEMKSGTPDQLLTLEVASQEVSSLECSRDDQVFAGTENGQVLIVDFKRTGENSEVIIEEESRIVCISINPKDTEKLAIVDGIGRLQMYCRRQGRWCAQWETPLQQGTSFVDFVRDGDSIVSVDSGYLITWRRADDGRRLMRYGMGRDITVLRAHPSANAVVVSFPQWENTPVLRLFERITPILLRRGVFSKGYPY